MIDDPEAIQKVSSQIEEMSHDLASLAEIGSSEIKLPMPKSSAHIDLEKLEVMRR